MIVILKSFSGCDYALKNGRVVSLKGGCYLNEVSSDDFNSLKSEYPNFAEAIDSGYIVAQSNKEIAKKSNENNVADTAQKAQSDQEATQAKNAKATGAKTKKK